MQKLYTIKILYEISSTLKVKVSSDPNTLAIIS